MRRRCAETRSAQRHAPRSSIIGGVMRSHPPARLQRGNLETSARNESSAARAKKKGRDERGPGSGRKSPKDLQTRSGRIRSRPAMLFYDAASEEIVNVAVGCA